MLREDESSWWSRWTYGWIGPLLRLGYRQSLTMESLPELDPSLRASAISGRFAEAWARERQRTAGPPSLVRALYSAFGRQFVQAGVARITGDMAMIFAPVLLLYIIRYINAVAAGASSAAWTGYALATGLFLLQVIQVVAINQSFERSMRFGFCLRTALVATVFEKSLRMSVRARQTYPAGRVMNIMSSDTNRLDLACQFVHFLYAAPLQMLVALALLVWQLDYSALAGFSLLVATIPFQLWATKRFGTMRSKASKISDQRIKTINEAVQGIKVIKLYAWEQSFQAQIQALRRGELRSIRWMLLLRALVVGLLQTVPILACIVTFIVYEASGKNLTDDVAFTGLALFYALRVPLLVYPIVLSEYADARVALRRIQELLLSEEITSEPQSFPFDADSKLGICIENATFIWDAQPSEIADKIQTASPTTAQSADKAVANEEQPAQEIPVQAQPLQDFAHPELEQASDAAGATMSSPKNPPAPPPCFTIPKINLSIPQGSLVVIIGPVGSGKSSFLSAIIGEMKRTAGSVSLYGSLAYCAQQAWIQNNTLQDNILFGKPMDEGKYREVVRVCALERDLEILAAGDQSEIGEQGIGLSGGQKQRVNLARAVYHDADIILMDDALSAVDAHVGSYIFDNCIMGALKSKTRLLVTHRLHILPRADLILVMDNGEMVAKGTFNELMENDTQFADLIKEFQSEQDDTAPVDEPRTAPTEMDPFKSNAKNDMSTTAPKQSGVTGKLISSEDRSTGQVGWSVYKEYFKLSGGISFVFLACFGLLLSQISRIANDTWLSVWTQETLGPRSGSFYELIFVGLGIAQAFIMVFSGAYIIWGTSRASGRAHELSVENVLRAPISWFDSQPLGRILNRFSRDVDVMDTLLPDSFRVFSVTFFMTAAIMATISVIFPLFLAPLLPVFGLFYWLQRYFRKSAVELKRLDNVSRSPLFAHFAEIIKVDVRSTIKAFGSEVAFCSHNKLLLDLNNRAYYLTFLCLRWLTLRMEILGSLLVYCVALFGVGFAAGSNPGLVGLSITYSLQVTGVFTWCVKQGTETEAFMSSVERLLHYTQDLPDEHHPWPKGSMVPNIDVIPLKEVTVVPPMEWPQKGTISVRDLVLRYREDLPDVLRAVSFDIEDGSKTGIVGRTGAGKSSLIHAFFLLNRPRSGTIFIDGVDISKVELYQLRKKIAIIPQDPVIFTGTLRSNLDPFKEHKEEEIWKCLDRCGLKSSVDNVQGLDMVVSTGGGNWSTGQRQLICLARAILRKAKILVLDEATASVDMRTDMLIQKSLREHFSNCTIVTIAHRLNTILDYDKIIVLDQGKVIEMGAPQVLLMNKDGSFSGMVAEQELSHKRK